MVIAIMKRKDKPRVYDPLLPPTTGAFAVNGRPLLYNKAYHCKLVYRLALLNLSNPEMCIPLDISLNVFNDWIRYHEEFKKALLAGREQADAKVARALFRRAVGWGTLEEEVVSRKIKDNNGNERLETKTIPKRKRYPPDVAAIALWLRNRHPDKWHITDTLAAQVRIPIQVNMDLSMLSLEDLRVAQRLGVAVDRNVIDNTYSEINGGNGRKAINE